MLLNLDCNMDIEFNRNVRPAMKLMEACSAQHVTKLLFLSSGGTVYGNHSLREPITEDSPTHPISLYGTSKLMIEQIGLLYHQQKGLPFIVARPSNAYGPGQLPYRGQGLVATAFASALDNKPLTIFGDGSVVRDFIHVRDIAEALVALIKNGRLGETYNVGTALGTSMKKLVDDYIVPILQEDQHKLNCQYSPARGVDVAYNVISNDKIYRDTGFKPRISLDEGLKETLGWIKNNYTRTSAEMR
jgi:UDP-glucose 4-epimerase